MNRLASFIGILKLYAGGIYPDILKSIKQDILETLKKTNKKTVNEPINIFHDKYSYLYFINCVIITYNISRLLKKEAFYYERILHT